MSSNSHNIIFNNNNNNSKYEEPATDEMPLIISAIKIFNNFFSNFIISTFQENDVSHENFSAF